MKKVLFGIFAHPDDEAFGPCGTLLKAVHEGGDVHLFTLTRGESGQNPDNVANLGEVREHEWRTAAESIGVTSLFNLHRPDGHLDNIAMQEITTEIEPKISVLISNYDEAATVEFITLDPNGLTGHIDHIVAARAASFIFYKLKTRGLPLKRIRYYCNSEELSPRYNIDWIYADKGHAAHEISETIDAREYQKKIIEIMRLHYSQRQDCEHVLAHQGENLGIDHFIVQE